MGNCEHGEFRGGKCHLADTEYGLSIKQGSRWFKIVEEDGICPLCDKPVKGYANWRKITKVLGPYS
jgi:hypothetical protein